MPCVLTLSVPAVRGFAASVLTGVTAASVVFAFHLDFGIIVGMGRLDSGGRGGISDVSTDVVDAFRHEVFMPLESHVQVVVGSYNAYRAGILFLTSGCPECLDWIRITESTGVVKRALAGGAVEVVFQSILQIFEAHKTLPGSHLESLT